MDGVKKFLNDYKWVIVVVILVAIGGFLIGTTPAPQPTGENGEMNGTSTTTGTSTATSTATSTTTTARPVTVSQASVSEALNGTYFVDFFAKNVKLENGSYKENVAGAAGTLTVTAKASDIAVGNLDSDAAEEMAVILYSTNNSAGVYTELAVLNKDTTGIRQVASVYLGDRVKIDALRIANGIITVTTKMHGPDDNLCCPTKTHTFRYKLEGGRLISA